MKKRVLTKTSILVLFLLVLIVGCVKTEEETNIKPSCTIITPLDDQEFIMEDTITIFVEAIDDDGSITEVIFFANGEILGYSYDKPYTYDWLINEVSAGYHSIRASSLDNNGSSNSDEIEVKIIHNEDAPLANFIVNVDTGPAPLSVHFYDKSTNEPTSWQWDFGDDDSSVQENPYHTYYETGVFTVTLIATNLFGSDTETKIDFIISLEGGNIGPFTDARDNQTYDSIQIGSQTWMMQNLNFEATEGSWVYADSSFNAPVYGRLYNWEAARTACPSGWHLPSDSEWMDLEMQLGMNWSTVSSIGWRGADEGNELKEAGTSHWNSLNLGATNSSGFSALPGGRYYNGNFGDLMDDAYFWTRSSNGSLNAWYRRLSSDIGTIGRSDVGNIEYGFSVRCVKDVN